MDFSIKSEQAICPVCHFSVAIPFFSGGDHPLATLGWPQSKKEAESMIRHPHDFMHCPKCTHVWNKAFSYDDIPYANNPNRMFNKGGVWRGHLAQTRDILLSILPKNPTVIDIGCGEGHFVRGIAEALNDAGWFVGFDPNTTSETGRGVEFFARYFEPSKHMSQFNPDLIIIRHVLEHFLDPTVFLESLAWEANKQDKTVLLFAEMPCVDRVFEAGRLADFFYEHPSHFTTKSFNTLMHMAGEIIDVSHGYDGEVIYGLVKLGQPDFITKNAIKSMQFNSHSKKAREGIKLQLDSLVKSGKRVVIWGGTGKAATFMHQYGVDPDRFPIVVDSDMDKVGTFVPGLGQEIRYRDYLKELEVDVIIIPPQWRANDVIEEMRRVGISVDQILIEHGGRLIDFQKEEHPYKKPVTLLGEA